jgi:hypothetical protein
VGCVARILSDGEMPVVLIESAGWFPIRVAVVDATLFVRSRVEGATLFEHLPPNPLRSGWGLTQSTG